MLDRLPLAQPEVRSVVVVVRDKVREQPVQMPLVDDDHGEDLAVVTKEVAPPTEANGDGA